MLMGMETLIQKVYLSCYSAELHCEVPASVSQTNQQDALAPKGIWNPVLLTV